MADAKMDLNEAFRPIRLLTISAEVIEEIGKARKKHGPNSDLADGTGPREAILSDANDLLVSGAFDGDVPDNESIAFALKNLNDTLCANGRKHTRLGILLEEAFEAAETTDLAELRAELIQVAAMAVDWVADIDVHPTI